MLILNIPWYEGLWESLWLKTSVTKNPIMAQWEIMDVKTTSVKQALQRYLTQNDGVNDRYVNHYYWFTAQQCLDPPISDFYHQDPEMRAPSKLTNQDIESAFHLLQMENQKSSSMVTTIQELNEEEFKYSTEVVEKCFGRVDSAITELKGLHFINCKEEILAKVDEITNELEMAKWASKDDWPLIASMGWWTVIDLNVVQKHLKEQEKIITSLQNKMSYLKWRDKKWVEKVLEEYDEGQEIFLSFDDEPIAGKEDTSSKIEKMATVDVTTSEGWKSGEKTSEAKDEDDSVAPEPIPQIGGASLK